jgi:hypothetical protein
VLPKQHPVFPSAALQVVGGPPLVEPELLDEELELDVPPHG